MIELAEYAAWFLLSAIGLVILYLAIRPFFKYIPPVRINGWTRLTLAVSLVHYPATQFLLLVFNIPAKIPYSGISYRPKGPLSVPSTLDTIISNAEDPFLWFIACWVIYFAAVWIVRGFSKKS